MSLDQPVCFQVPAKSSVSIDFISSDGLIVDRVVITPDMSSYDVRVLKQATTSVTVLKQSN